ncbi:HAD family hydrolase [Clostridium amazonitimonense]|uniref:HAD family hydrolase n=1 Tax=Clostridium amazonitimonense TaxID=1499689 RepID=UPI000509FB4B|nr:HAD family hydrolase [Clostridium amazonitimonense]
MKKQTIIFDLDDTLIHCNKYFHGAIDTFSEKMCQWFGEYNIEFDEIKTKQQEIDIQRVIKQGFADTHFSTSLIDTYIYFSQKTGRARNKEEEKWINYIGESAYEQELECYPFMKDILNLLSEKGHKLYLYTAGSNTIQKRKIDRVNIGNFFQDRVFITPHKNAEVLEAIILKENLDKKNTWMVGNSMKSDIMPAVKAGIKAIFIPGLFQWEYDNVTLKDEHKESFITVQSLQQLRDIFIGEEAV